MYSGLFIVFPSLIILFFLIVKLLRQNWGINQSCVLLTSLSANQSDCLRQVVFTTWRHRSEARVPLDGQKTPLNPPTVLKGTELDLWRSTEQLACKFDATEGILWVLGGNLGFLRYLQNDRHLHSVLFFSLVDA